MIKRVANDNWFSHCVRMRTNYTCESCGTEYQPNDSGCQASHYFSRSHYSTRFCGDNCFTHCTSCHFKLGSNPDDFYRFAKNKLGEGILEILREKRDDIELGRTIRKDAKAKLISKYYKKEFERMKAMRDEGVVGRIEFTDYC